MVELAVTVGEVENLLLSRLELGKFAKKTCALFEGPIKALIPV
jgi:hypothetical protein